MLEGLDHSVVSENLQAVKVFNVHSTWIEERNESMQQEMG